MSVNSQLMERFKVTKTGSKNSLNKYYGSTDDDPDAKGLTAGLLEMTEIKSKEQTGKFKQQIRFTQSQAFGKTLGNFWKSMINLGIYDNW